MTDIKPEDEVRVFDRNGRRAGQPDGGWVGHVVKAGPKLVHITYGGYWGDKPKAFRRDTGYANDNYQHQWFETLEETARNARRAAAVEVLKAHRIMLDFGHSLTLEQIEALAEVVKTWED